MIMSRWNPTLLTVTDNRAAAAVLSVTSEDSEYLKENLQALPVALAYRTSSITAPQNVNADLGSPQAVTLIALVNHNLTSGAVITVKAGTTSGVGDFSEVMEWREEDAFVLLSAAQTYRYWRVEIDDDSNPEGFLEIGYLMIGQAARHSLGPKPDSIEVTDEFINSEEESEYGVPHVEEIFHRVRIRFDYELDPSEDSTARAGFRALKKNLTPFFFIPDVGAYDGYFGRWVADLARSYSTNIWTSTWEFLQDGYGRSVGS